MKNLTAVFLIASIATLRVSHADEAAQPQAVVIQEEKTPEQTPQVPQTPVAAQEEQAPEQTSQAPQTPVATQEERAPEQTSQAPQTPVATQEERAPEQTSQAPQTPVAAQEVESPELSTEAPASAELQTDEKPAYTHVGKASHDSVAAAKSKQWQNILIAAGAVAIAITALILVHNNAGH